MRVLIFDDDAGVGRLAARVATISGLEASTVATADQFAQHLLTDRPHVVLLDLQLGDTDGVEQLRFLAERRYAGMVVLMSGFDSRVLNTARALGQSLDLRVSGVLEKPLRVGELEALFESLQSADRVISIERLREAIANNELVLEFQPVVCRNPKRLTKLEGLVRWDHPAIGRISPGDFLPMAESDAATIDALTEWVVGAAVDAYQLLTPVGIAVPLAVNISTQNLHDLTLPDRLGEHLRRGGMPAHHLCLEITEGAAFRDIARTMDILSRVRLKGMQLSIDDFGTGYSSLKMLRQMPFSEIKIDQSFVSDATTSRDSRAIVKSIIDLAANMDMGCVAEGVETEATADLLEQLGVRELQGYLIARPMPAEAVAAWLASWLRPGAATPGDQGDAARLDAPSEGAPAEAAPGEAAPGEAAVPQLLPSQAEAMQLLSERRPHGEMARRTNADVHGVTVELALACAGPETNLSRDAELGCEAGLGHAADRRKARERRG